MLNKRTRLTQRKILFGAVDIGFRIEHYTAFINKHFSKKLKPESFVIYKIASKIYHTAYTYEYQLFNKPSIYRWLVVAFNFFRFIFRYNTFHFLSGETLLTRKLRKFEFSIYKLLNKKIIMHFVGADIRSIEHTKWKDNNIESYLQGKDNRDLMHEPYQTKLIADANRFAKYILVSTPDLLELIPRAIYFPVVIDLEKYIKELNLIEAPLKNENEVVILHSPSNTSLKGTERIHKILHELENETSVKIRLVLPAKEKSDFSTNYSTTRYNLFKLYKQADIVIDQMVIGWYGLQSLEALAAQKLTICYIDNKFKQHLFDNCPIVQADLVDLKEVLKKCVLQISQKNFDSREQLNWVRKYHTIDNYKPLLEKIWIED